MALYLIWVTHNILQGLHHFLGIPNIPLCRSRLYPEHLYLLAKFGTSVSTGHLHILNTLLQKNYLDKHEWQSDLIQSFLPTFLVSLLAILIPPAPTADRQEGAHDHHPLCPSRLDHDEILQVLGGQSLGVLLRWNCGSTVIFSLHQELHRWDRYRHYIKQFPKRGPFLRWLV
jgi:hypothetical protein